MTERIDELARSVAQAFEKQSEYLALRFELIDRRFGELAKDLDVRSQFRNNVRKRYIDSIPNASYRTFATRTDVYVRRRPERLACPLDTSVAIATVM